MTEIVNMVSQKTGLDEAKSQQAVDTVLGFLRDKLPAPIASQVERVMSGDGGAGKEKGGGVAGAVKDMIGGHKQ
jgi:hypothetical protein